MKPMSSIIANVDVPDCLVDFAGLPVPIIGPRRICHRITSPVFWLLLVLLCYGAQPITATILIAVVGPDMIYLGADGRETFSEGNSVETCKIEQTGKYFFMATGLANDKVTGFDLSAIAKDALSQKTGLLTERIAKFDKVLRPKLHKAAVHVKSAQPIMFSAHLSGKALDNVFATWENGHPLLIRDGWKVSESGRPYHVMTRPVSIETHDNLILDASRKGAAGYWESHPELATMSPVPLFTLLIQVEIDQAKIDPSVLTGPPITVLSINRNGAVWYQQGRCPAITAY
jgi:hypothetical protein